MGTGELTAVVKADARRARLANAHELTRELGADLRAIQFLVGDLPAKPHGDLDVIALRDRLNDARRHVDTIMKSLREVWESTNE